MPLRLDLLRHGEALPAGSAGDVARTLSPAGARHVARVADEFASRGWRPDRVFSSPLLRAQMTAALLVSRLALELQWEVLAELVPDHEPEDVVDALDGHRASGHVLLIGHQPLMGRLAAYLTGGQEPQLPPAALIRIAFAERLARGAGTIELEIRPDRLS